MDSRDEYNIYFSHGCLIEGDQYIYIYKTRMTSFIKTKIKKSDDQTNIVKYRVPANNTEYHIITKLIFR